MLGCTSTTFGHLRSQSLQGISSPSIIEVFTFYFISHLDRAEREHRRRHQSRRLLLMVYVAWACLRPCLLYLPRHSPPDGVTLEGGHLHWPLYDSTGVSLRAPRHRGTRIILDPHWLDVSIRHLEHAKHEDDQKAPRNLPSLIPSHPIYRGGGPRRHY